MLVWYYLLLLIAGLLFSSGFIPEPVDWKSTTLCIISGAQTLGSLVETEVGRDMGQASWLIFHAYDENA